MSASLRIKFDRQDRTYRFGEQVSGNVILETLDKLTCRKIMLEYGWRTHGKGNVDRGTRDFIILQGEEIHLSQGEHRTYPFAFTAPNGPVTYHGVLINVDWYLVALADIPLAPDLKDEEDFLLLPAESPAVIILGDTELSPIQTPSRLRNTRYAVSRLHDPVRNQPVRKPISPFTLLYASAVILMFFVSIFLELSRVDFKSPLLIFIIAAALILVLVFLIRYLLSRVKLNVSEIKFEPAEVYTGEQLTCQLQFTTRGAVYLDSISALLIAEEIAVRGAGTNETTSKHTAYQYSFVKPYNESLLAGRWISCECPLPIPPSAPATFIAKSNQVKWSVKIKIKFRRWPSWGKTVPLTVLPG